MARINTRSPYWVNINEVGISYAILKLYVYTGNSSNVPTEPTYQIRKSVLSGQETAYFEVSELVRDELDTVFDGDYNGQAVWVRMETFGYDVDGDEIGNDTNTIIAFDGYNYFEEQNADENNIMITNRELFVLEDNTFRLPIYTGLNAPTVVFYKDGEIIASETFSYDQDSSNQIKYVSIYGDTVNWDTFEERVLEDGGVDFENSVCLQSFFNNYSIGAVDKIEVSGSGQKIQTIKVNVLEECKYEPKKVTFINKFGALQDMYFFKKAVEKMTVKKESYKANILNANKTYSISSHTNRDFNITAKESITMSSGFLSEEYNEVFKQMMLSEKVWVTNIIETGEQVLPINVKTSNITYKTSLNDRLVDYTFDFDYSFNVINNIR
tara:strand:+ start:915 stop:2060 length:1146 start_codon:yes stop_codon:yes gene_type:complete